MQKFSLIDYPGRPCAIVFTMGCNFKCPYCHNPELISLTKKTFVVVSEQEILRFLESRKGKIDAVSITGGEPTLHDDLLDFMFKLKTMGFLIKLDSNGTRPLVLQEALDKKLVDCLAMDVKAPLAKYNSIVASPVVLEDIKKSIDLIKNSGIDYEFRTTIVKSLLSKEDILEIGDLVSGARRYYLQKFVPTKTYDSTFLTQTTYSDEEFETLRKEIAPKVQYCKVR
ncbi:MAG: anaerobic ribonucleoside-triphosphate reductase activating protein [Patescibacteria group bacterium]